MKQAHPSFIENIGLALFQKVVTIGTLLGTILCAGLLQHLAGKYNSGALTAMAGVVFLTGLLLSLFTCREVFERMRQDKAMLFSEAVKHTFYGYPTLPCFLPIIGPPLSRFVEKEKPQNPFTSDEA